MLSRKRRSETTHHSPRFPYNSADCTSPQSEGTLTPKFTMHDVLVLCDHEERESKDKAGAASPGIHAGYLKPGMTVLDLTASLRKSALLLEAEARGCKVVSPRKLLREQLARQLRLITGQDVPDELWEQKLTVLVEDEF